MKDQEKEIFLWRFVFALIWNANENPTVAMLREAEIVIKEFIEKGLVIPG